ncbi:MAG: ubiquitin-like domain-containing protein [Candidatus Saccharimonadales bacterium]
MKRLLRKATTIIGVSVIAVGLLVCSLLSFNQTAGATNQSGRLITIHDRGDEKVLLSNAATIGDALKDAGIVIDNRDAVEPKADVKLVASEYQINIYRARPVLIIDGATRQKIVTPYQTPEQILKDVGTTLYPEDKAKITQSENILVDGAGLLLTIDRATVFNFNLYGNRTEARTQGATVADMLRAKGLELDASDRVSVPLTTPITPGLEVRVWREGKQTVTVQEPVQFDTEQIRDADHEIGYKAVQTAGQVGQRNVTYEIEIQDGVEVNRKEIVSLVTTEPLKQIEIIGVKPKTLPYTGGGTKSEWLGASNIAESDWGYADFMVGRESGWNPNSVNKSSGACGLAQALPCSKVPGNPYNPIDSLNWMNSYVNGRYGGWANAYAFWNAHHWY